MIKKIEELFLPGVAGPRQRRLRIVTDGTEVHRSLLESGRLPELAELHPRNDELEVARLELRPVDGSGHTAWILDVFYRRFSGKREP
jgi:hypothetical protein